jgi:methionine-S-sulfoxide reductase
MRLLLKHGADYEHQTLGGATALHVAASVGQIEALKVLTGGEPVRANLMAEDKAQSTPRDVANRTGHTEAVQVVWDPSKTSIVDILRWFWESHDPTQGMGQGNDRGTQYRSGIYFFDEEQKKLAMASKETYQVCVGGVCVCESVPSSLQGEYRAGVPTRTPSRVSPTRQLGSHQLPQGSSTYLLTVCESASRLLWARKRGG